MEELAGRLTALDPDAGVAVRVIAYFDRLAESRAGLEALVRGVAVLAGCPARLVDEERRVRVRVEPDGTRSDTRSAPDAAWPREALRPSSPDSDAALWLERDGGAPSVVDAVILERAAGVIRQVLDRTRGRAVPEEDLALVETLLDASADEQARLVAAKRLGLDTAATEINVHHSTMQVRIAHAEALLGWSIHAPQGLWRLQLALAMCHLAATAGG